MFFLRRVLNRAVQRACGPLPWWIFIGGPNILAKGADDMLKLLDENLSTSQALSFGLYYSVGAKGSRSGLAGVGCLGMDTSSSVSFSSFLLSLSVRDDTIFAAWYR